MKDLDCYDAMLSVYFYWKYRPQPHKYFCSQAFLFVLTTSMRKHVQIIKHSISTEGEKT